MAYMQRTLMGSTPGGDPIYAPNPNSPGYQRHLAQQAASAPQMPTMPQGYSPSPFLGAQIGQLGQQINQDFTRNTLPTIRSNSIGNGGFGGSRQGLAEGIAAGDASRGFSNAATNLLGQDYQAQMGRNLQQYQGDQSFYLGNKNADNQYSLGQANIGLGYAGLANSKDIAGMNNATQRYGIDAQTGLGYAGLQNQSNIAGMQNATTQRGQDMSLQGQMAGYDTQRYGIDQNNATNRYGMDLTNSYQNRALDVNNAYNNRALDVNMRGQDLTWQNNNNQYNLGMTNANNTRYGMDLQNQYNMGQLQLGNDRARNDFYTQQRQGDQAAWDGAANLYSNTLRTAAGAGYGGNGSSGVDWQGIIGGGIAGTQFAKNLGLL